MAYWLALRSASGGIRSFPINAGETIVGRDTRCALRVALPSVSNEHCAMKLDPDAGELTIFSKCDDNPTIVNGTPVSKHRLNDGDEVTIGSVTFRVYASSSRTTTNLPGQIPMISDAPPHRAGHTPMRLPETKTMPAPTVAEHTDRAAHVQQVREARDGVKKQPERGMRPGPACPNSYGEHHEPPLIQTTPKDAGATADRSQTPGAS
ncbi:MAG: FHA domain-containing protein [Phycisphaerales bacterium]|nr:FHA domain-containing protein [Phycisphaerales bacterium]